MDIKKKLATTICAFLFVFTVYPATGEEEIIKRRAKTTLTPVELDLYQTLEFTLLNGQIRRLTVLETSANVVITNLATLKKDQPHGATLYRINAKVRVDGHEMTMERYVGSQESFYEPYVINGMRIWFDGVTNITEVVIDEHGGVISDSRPNRAARFAVADMNSKIAPVDLFPLYRNTENMLRIENSYNGDDCWMGAYNGFEAHGGLDINQTKGIYNYTPFPIDDHYFFKSLAAGDNNNRWRGVRRWPNGDVWAIQNHHMLNLLVPEHQPIPAGVRYAEAAGVHVGNHTHSHYVFRVRTPEDTKDILLDPWIIFWQIFEDNRARAKEIKAHFSPLQPGKTNGLIRFNSAKSTAGLNTASLSYYWSFGDGGTSIEKNPSYTFVNPGIYPVTLVVDNGAERSSFTQHITVDGAKSSSPSLTFSADEPAFVKRKVHVMDVYGSPVKVIPNSLFFLARATNSKPEAKTIKLVNSGGGKLPAIKMPAITYLQGKGWLTLQAAGTANDQQIAVSVDASGLKTGMYTAMIQIESPGAKNGLQHIYVELSVPAYPPAHPETQDLNQEIIDNADERYHRFYSTPYFWVAPRFKRWPDKGYYDFYLTNGGRSAQGEYARFRPDLEAGRYEVTFVKQTPFDPQKRAMKGSERLPVNTELNPAPRFAVRVHSKNGDKTIWVNPAENTQIGVFEFAEGMDGFVDILSEGSTGQVLVDAIVFKKL